MPITKCTHAFLLPARNVLAGPGFALIVCVVLAFGTQSPAQSFTDLYDFQGTSDGFSPNVPIAGPDGAIYATTLSGGNLNCAGGFGGCGTVFRWPPPLTAGGNFPHSTTFKAGKTATVTPRLRSTARETYMDQPSAAPSMEAYFA